MKTIIFSAFFVILFIGNVFSNEKYQKRINAPHSVWESFIPRYSKIQFAGSMGFLSCGIGWNYWKNQLETDIFFGFLPKYSTNRPKVTFTLKQNYIPWKIPIKNSRFIFEPFTFAVYLNTIFGKDFWQSKTHKHPIDTRFRFNFAIGERITYDIPDNKRFFAKSIAFFYEIGSNDIALMNGLQNKYVKPLDFIKLSLGIKIQLL